MMPCGDISVCGASFRWSTRRLHYNVLKLFFIATLIVIWPCPGTCIIVICTSSDYRVCQKKLVTGDNWNTSSAKKQAFVKLLFCNKMFAVTCSNCLNTLTLFPVTAINVGIRPQNFLTFSFNPFDRLV